MQITKKALSYGPILIIIAALLWALDGVIRRSLFSLPPITIIFFEHLFGMLVLLPFMWRSLLGIKLSKREWFLMILISLLSGLVGTLFFTAALLKTSFISFSVVFLLQKLQPIFAIGSARIFLKEKLRKGYLVWAIVALVAAYFVTFKTGLVNFGTGAGTMNAALLALGAAFAWGTSTTFSKMMLTNHSSTYTTAMRFTLTTIAAFILVLIFGKFNSVTALTFSQGIRLLVITFSTGMVALLIYYRGLKFTPVRVSTILELTFPLVAIIIDMFVYHNRLSISQWIAAAVLLFAMYQITKKEKDVIQSPLN